MLKFGLQADCRYFQVHDVQFSCAITQPLLAHGWRVHQCLLTSRVTAPLIPWGASAPGAEMRKQLLKEHNFLNNSPIFIIESSTFIYLFFKKHPIHYISIWKIVLDLVKGTWDHNFMAGCGSLLWANTCSLWSGIKSWPGAGCLQRQVKVYASFRSHRWFQTWVIVRKRPIWVKFENF